MKLFAQGKTRKGVTRVILLFDEAQGLMDGKDSSGGRNLFFRTVRWWLRQLRNEHVLAVFAGTTAALTNFFPPDPPRMEFSRLAGKSFKNYNPEKPELEAEKKLYQPFFELNTIGCLVNFLSSDAKSSMTELQVATLYGRPLFAHYSMKNALNRDKILRNCMKRLLLSSDELLDDLEACFSVLGARVQMGTVQSFQFSSRLVSSGYACLASFQPVQSKNRGYQSAVAISFMPDPYCAWMAMQLMNEEWKVRLDVGELVGKPMTFWVEKAADAFRNSLCTPDKGDAGELFVALYMLGCADILRHDKDGNEGKLSVSLEDWFQLLKSGGQTEAGISGRKTGQKQEARTVSFIQFCRSHWRSNSFCTSTKVLEQIYLSGVAQYAYKNCEAIDMTAAICCRSKGKEPSYHPLLVSVKNRATADCKAIEEWFESIKKYLNACRQKEEGECPRALCLIVLAGCDKHPEDDALKSLLDNSLRRFPREDTYCLIIIPQADKLGVSKALRSLEERMEQTEVYVSHGFLAAEDVPTDKLLRKATKMKAKVTVLKAALPKPQSVRTSCHHS